MTENDLRDVVRNAFNRAFPGCHQSWVESHETSPGFPDLDVCAGGAERKVELKIVKAKGAIEIRPTQYRWFKDRVKAGGRPVMWVEHEDWHYIVDGMSVSLLDNIKQIIGAREGQPTRINCVVFQCAEDAARYVINGEIKA